MLKTFPARLPTAPPDVVVQPLSSPERLTRLTLPPMAPAGTLPAAMNIRPALTSSHSTGTLGVSAEAPIVLGQLHLNTISTKRLPVPMAHLQAATGIQQQLPRLQQDVRQPRLLHHRNYLTEPTLIDAALLDSAKPATVGIAHQRNTCSHYLPTRPQTQTQPPAQRHDLVVSPSCHARSVQRAHWHPAAGPSLPRLPDPGPMPLPLTSMLRRRRGQVAKTRLL